MELHGQVRDEMEFRHEKKWRWKTPAIAGGKYVERKEEGRRILSVPSSYTIMGRIAAVSLVAAIFCLYHAKARAQDVEEGEWVPPPRHYWVDYLHAHPPSAKLCLEHSPAALMEMIGEKHDLHDGGTPGGEADNVDIFFAAYLKVLRPAVDARHPRAKAMREPLQKLLMTIYDFLLLVNSHRSYVTAARMEACTEHIIARVYEPGAFALKAANGSPSHADVVAFARLEAKTIYDNQRVLQEKDFPDFIARVSEQLADVENATPKSKAAIVRLYILDFIGGDCGIAEGWSPDPQDR